MLKRTAEQKLKAYAMQYTQPVLPIVSSADNTLPDSSILLLLSAYTLEEAITRGDMWLVKRFRVRSHGYTLQRYTSQEYDTLFPGLKEPEKQIEGVQKLSTPETVGMAAFENNLKLLVDEGRATPDEREMMNKLLRRLKNRLRRKYANKREIKIVS